MSRFDPVACLLRTDAYKLGHKDQYALAGNVTRVFSNYTNRKSRLTGVHHVVHFGLQAYIQRYLMDDFEAFFDADEDLVCDLYYERVKKVLGRGRADTIGTDHIRALHRVGYLPLRFCAVPEGTLVPIKVPCFTVENTLPEFAWLTNYIETGLSAGVWQPSTSATIALQYRKLLDAAAELTGASAIEVDYQCHDFSYRGMSSHETAAASAAGHLLSFKGTDSLCVMDWIDDYYGGAYDSESIAACYDDQTQLLTEDGFKLFANLAPGERVAQYHPDGTISFVIPTDVFKDRYAGRMVVYSGTRYIDAIVTPNHRMVTRTRDGVVELNETKDMRRNNRHIPVGGRAVGGALQQLTDLDRLEIAFQADGSYASRAHRYSGARSGVTQPIRFTIKKERKKKRLREILNRLGFEYSETPQNRSGYSHFWIKCPETLHKSFDWIPYGEISSDWASEFVEEVSYWDAQRHVNSFQYSSSDPDCVEAVQTVAVLAGYLTYRSTYDDPRTTRKVQHIVSVTRKDAVCVENVSESELDYDGFVYCVSVPTKMLVVRRNHRVMICGNTEHSVMSAGTASIGEFGMYEALLDLYPDGNVAIVSDTYDLWKVLTEYLPALKTKIMARDRKLVIRPDSGDPYKILCGDPDAPENHPDYLGVVRLLAETFGTFRNEAGFKVLDPHIGAIYGDSITVERAKAITARLARMGFVSTTVTLGVGSFSYQHNTRDTLGSAMKATWALVDGDEVNLFKDPITDDGTKKSATGRLAVVFDAILGDLMLIERADPEQEACSVLQPVWENGEFVRRQVFGDVRNVLATQVFRHRHLHIETVDQPRLGAPDDTWRAADTAEAAEQGLPTAEWPPEWPPGAETHIDVRFNFDAVHEDGHTYYNLVSAERIGTDIPDDAMLGIGETLAQFDHWNVGGVGATLSAMVDDDGEPKIVRDYW